MSRAGHFCFALLATAAVFACCVVVVGLVDLVGTTSLGFSMVREGYVNSIGVPSSFKMWDRILSVDGAAVASKDDVIERATARPVGSLVSYEVESITHARKTVSIATHTLTPMDLLKGQGTLALLGVAFVLIAVVFYFLRPGTKEAWSFFLLFAAIGIAMISVVDLTMLWKLPPLYLVVAPSIGTLGMILVGVICDAYRQRAIWIITALCLVVGAVLSTLLVTNLENIQTYDVVDGAFYWWLTITTTGALILLGISYFNSKSPERRARIRQLLWVWPIGAGIPTANLLIGHSLHGAPTSLIWNGFLLLVPISTADAIVRHDLLLLNHRARRAIGSLTIAIVVGILLGLLLLGAMQFLAIDDASAIVAIAAVLFAAAAPINYRIHRYIERLLRARRYDGSRLLAAFSARASTATQLAEVVDRLRQTLARSIAPSAFELYRFDQERNVLAPQVIANADIPVDAGIAGWLHSADPIVVDERKAPVAIEQQLSSTALAVRLAVANEAVGLLVVTARPTRTPYEETDVSFVGALAGPLAAALINTLAFEKLESRVAARTEELAQTNLELARLNTQKDEMLRTVSHDFRSPLGVIRFNVQTLLRDLNVIGKEEMREFLETVDAQEHTLTALCTSLLDLARLKDGAIARAPVKLAELCTTLVRDLTPRARELGIELGLTVDADAPTLVDGDAVRLQQVARNLIENALKFTAAAGHVRVRLARAPGDRALLLEVADDGCGVAEEAVRHLFEPFFQVPQGTKRREGFGLGLAIVKAAVDAHHGVVSVHSALSQGTRFHVFLPGASL